VFRTEFESPQRILLRIAIPIIPSKHSHTQPNKKKLIFVETSLEFLIAVKEWLHNRGHRGGDLVERGSLDVRLADDLAHAGVGEDRSVWEAPTVDVLTASEAIGSIEDVQLSAWRAVGLAHHPRHQALEPPLVGVDAQATHQSRRNGGGLDSTAERGLPGTTRGRQLKCEHLWNSMHPLSLSHHTSLSLFKLFLNMMLNSISKLCCDSVFNYLIDT